VNIHVEIIDLSSSIIRKINQYFILHSLHFCETQIQYHPLNQNFLTKYIINYINNRFMHRRNNTKFKEI